MASQNLVEQIISTAREQGLSQAELAERAGIRQETLSRAKKNPNINLRHLERLARVAGLRLQLIPDNPVAEQVSTSTLFPSAGA